MTEYNVSIPITGTVCVTVEAENEEEAKAKAFDSEDLKLENIEQWEAHDQITKGNILYASQNEVEVYEA